ncbi:MAG TPA: hypothetical protein VD866_21970 [Urbifossiella sp.]|nr:hypothetical protein [Urbifossiella sp.]
MRWLLALTLAAAVPAAAGAADVRFADGTPVTLADVSKAFEKENKRSLEDRWGRVAAGGFAPLSQPDRKAKASGAPAITFLARVNCLYEVQGPPGDWKYFLVASGSIADNTFTILGWVPEVFVLTGTRCQEDPASAIQIKAMAINSLRYLKAGAAPEETRIAPPRVLAAPPPFAGADLGASRFFEFYYVWADTDRENEDRGYALIAEAPSVNPNNEMTDADFRRLSGIIGWIEKPRLCFWRTREAVQWDDLNQTRTNPGRAYATRDQARADIDPAAATAPAGADALVTERFTNGRPTIWDPRRMRYPLLSMRVPDGVGADGAPRTKEVAYESFRGNTLRHVGVIGDVFDKDGKPAMTEDARLDVQLDINRAREQVRRTEILFVIDRTVSMKGWWKKTADAVDELVTRVNREERSVAVGFCYFGDVNNGSPEREGQVGGYKEALAKNYQEALEKGGVFAGRLLDTKTDAAELQAKLKELAEPREMPGGGRLELVYTGLEAGIREARGWTRNARKMVILLGDDGNHRLPPDQERAVHDRLAKLLVPTPDAAAAGVDYETPKEFYALQMCALDPRPDDPTQLFKTQMDDLIGRIKARSKTAEAGYFNTTDQKSFFTAVDAQYAKLKALADRGDEEFRRIQTGQVDAVTEIRDPEVVNILRGIAARRKVRVEDLLRGVQAFDQRFVWELDPKQPGVRQLRKMVLVNHVEFDRIHDVLKNFFNDPVNPPALDQLAHLVLNAQAGDIRMRDRVKTLADAERLDVMRVTYGFSFVNELSAFLGYNRGAGAAPPKRDEKSERDFKRRLLKKYLLLEDIRQNRVREYGPIDDQDAVHVQPLAGRDRELPPDARRRFKRGDGSVEYYWIDFDREWP